MLQLGIFITLLVSCNSRLAEDHLHIKDDTLLPQAVTKEQVAPLTTSPSTVERHVCFYEDKNKCLNMTNECMRIDTDELLCCNVDSARINEGLSSELTNGNQEILRLHVVNATIDFLNVSQPHWRRLTSIAFTDGNITEIIGEFKKHSLAACLNISNNGITNIQSRALVNLFNLTTLDLSQNKLTGIPNFNARERDFTLNIQGNNGMLCKSVLDAYDNYNERLNLINTNTTYCTSSKSFQWFNSTELVSITQVKLMYKLKNDCVGNPETGAKCLCSPVRLDIVPDKPPTYSVAVDCSNKSLTRPPPRLPPNTIELNISLNRITSLSFLSEDTYEHVRKLFADHNSIQSIAELQGTKFIDNFIHLSLKYNTLKSIETYILSDTFDRNWSPSQVFLAHNKINCDCTTAKETKNWLLSKANNIPDYDKIYCENIPNQQVINLSENKVCPRQRDWTYYIYYIITAEILLLVGLITKVSYDYYVFKNAGYLPWPANKMPKLPCDWLCE